MESSILIYVVIALLVGIALTFWIFQKRRHVDNKGLEKGTAKNPEQVKTDNPSE